MDQKSVKLIYDSKEKETKFKKWLSSLDERYERLSEMIAHDMSDLSPEEIKKIMEDDDE